MVADKIAARHNRVASYRNYVGAVERAERTPSIVQAEKLARALGTTLSEMLAELEASEVSRGPTHSYPGSLRSPRISC